MKQNVTIYLALLIFGLCIQQSEGFQTLPIELNRTNLTVNYSFFLIKVIHVPKPNNEMAFFTVIVTPKGGHKPENFEGWLEIKDSQRRIVITRVCPSKSPNTITAIRQDVPKQLREKSVAFEFEVSTNYLAMSEFKLVEPLAKLEDNPTTYYLNLGRFADEQSTIKKSGE